MTDQKVWWMNQRWINENSPQESDKTRCNNNIITVVCFTNDINGYIVS